MLNQLIPHLFRTEYSKIVAVLCKTYGLSNIETAEDFVSDAFFKASEIWKAKGVPEYPKAWLYTVAKNKAKDHFKRSDLYHSKVEKELISSHEPEMIDELDLSEHNIKDSQLRMIFAVCDPVISAEAQVALALRVLCGFGIEEIASALLSTKSTINKKLFRSKEKLKSAGRDLLFPKEEEFEKRVGNVLSVIYLLFNEGYYSSTQNQKIQKELCLEAMRLLNLILSNDSTNLPQANALMALFCFHSSRFEARVGADGTQILMEDQDQSKWDQELIQKGEDFLRLSSVGEESQYHLEALIAFAHVRILDNEQEKWASILQFYNRLLQLNYSPIIALNRTYALSKVKGKASALKEALKIDLKESHLYYALLAGLYEVNSKNQKEALETGLATCRLESDRHFFKQKLSTLV